MCIHRYTQVTKPDTHTQTCTHSHTQSHLSLGDGQGRPLNPVHGCAAQDQAARVICPRPHNVFIPVEVGVGGGEPTAGLPGRPIQRETQVKGLTQRLARIRPPIQPRSGISQSVCADALDVCVHHVCEHTYMIAPMIISINNHVILKGVFLPS